MDTRKLLNDALLYHKQGKSILDGMGIDGVTYEEEYYYDLRALAGKGDIMAAEFLSIDSIQNLLIDQEEDSFLDGKTDCQYELAASNGSKYGGLCMLLCGKYSNDQSLINQYAQYASVEEEFGYCKPQPAQTETQISSPVQPDTRKLLNDVLLYHKQGKSILDVYTSLGWEHEVSQAGKGDIMAAEFLCIDSLQCLFVGQYDVDRFLYEKTDCQYELAASNGSKYGGLCMLLCGKYSNDQSLINQYAQYASVEEEFGYCKPQPAQTETQISSPVQSVPVSSTPYHLALGKERLGEHTLEQIKQKLEQGTLDLASKAWQQGWPEWKLISEVPEIASILASQPPPLPDDGPPPL